MKRKWLHKHWREVLLSLWLAGTLMAVLYRQRFILPKIVFCDVGQGDATIFNIGALTMVIDGGPDASVLSCLQTSLPAGTSRIEMLVLTHPDLDHYGGLIAILQTYQVGRVLLPPAFEVSSEFQQFYNLVWKQKENSGLIVSHPVHAQKWCLSDSWCCQVLSDDQTIPPENIWQVKQPNNKILGLFTENNQFINDNNSGSIVLNCDFIDKRIMITGDIKQVDELAFMSHNLLTKVDILKVAHHGSKTSTSTIFLEKIKPEHSVIMCGRENSYGHPHPATLANLQAVGTRVWRTDQQGTITFSRLPSGKWRIDHQY